MRLLLTALLALVVHGCVPFDPEEDRFTCASDEDCNDGYTCGGHTAVKGKPYSYCVPDGEELLGVSFKLSHSPFPCTVIFGPDDLTLQFDVVTSENTAALEGLEPDPAGFTNGQVDIPTCDVDDSVLNGGDATCFVGEPTSQGGGVFMIYMEPKRIDDVAAQLVYRDDADEVMMVAFGHGAVGDLPRVDIDVRTFDLDIPEAGDPTAGVSQRCLERGAPRDRYCGGDHDVVGCNCTLESDPCPVNYICNNATVASCWPRYWAEPGETCNEDTKAICQSGSCDGGTCH